jgi:hypothetical protein
MLGLLARDDAVLAELLADAVEADSFGAAQAWSAGEARTLQEAAAADVVARVLMLVTALWSGGDT